MQNENFIYITNNFNSPRTWVNRILLFFIFSGAIAYLPFEAIYNWLKFIAIIVLLLIIVMNPRKELGVDNEYLYFIDVSILKRFSKTRKYKISGIESIRTNGIHSKTTEIIDLFAPANHGGFANNIEITFKNNSSESFQIPIYKKDLNAIIKIVKDKMVTC